MANFTVKDVLTVPHFMSLELADQNLILNQLHEILKYRGKGDEERLCQSDMAVEKLLIVSKSTYRLKFTTSFPLRFY